MNMNPNCTKWHVQNFEQCGQIIESAVLDLLADK